MGNDPKYVKYNPYTGSSRYLVLTVGGPGQGLPKECEWSGICLFPPTGYHSGAPAFLESQFPNVSVHITPGSIYCSNINNPSRNVQLKVNS